MSKLLYQTSEWTPGLIADALAACEEIGREELGMNIRPNQVEIISADQMLEAYTSHGMPIDYNHWSRGKSFITQKQSYAKGHSGLAYEIVINSNPVIALFMEGNTMTMQTLVAAHACVGHNYVFENNYLFKQWTDPNAIVDYLLFAKHYVQQCEERYGLDEVELTLDAAHALQNVSADKYKRPPKMNKELQRQREMRLIEAKEKERNPFEDLMPEAPVGVEEGDDDSRLKEPEENILYFIEKNAPNLKHWQRELVRIVRVIGQYFYPQRQTQTVNEGCATFTHYYIMNRLYEKGMISEGNLLEFLHNHTAVVHQPTVDKPYYSGINPYALGFAMFQDIKRICEKPTSEDREWFPDLVDTDWKAAVRFAVENFRDETFVSQYLSPKLIRDWRMFTLHDSAASSEYVIKSIHDEAGYRSLRESLSTRYRMESHTPNMAVVGAAMKGDRTLYLEHHTDRGVTLDSKSASQTLEYVQFLWGYPVNLQTKDYEGSVLQTMVKR